MRLFSYHVTACHITKTHEKNALTARQLADEYFERTIIGHWKHPNIGKVPVKEVKPKHIDDMLQTIVKRGAPTTANDVLRWVRRVFDYAVKRHGGQNPPYDFMVLVFCFSIP